MQLNLTESENQVYQQLLVIVDSWRRLGEKKYPDGTRWIGHTPYLFPEAYLHKLYSPLDEILISDLEDQLEYDLPDSFRRFLKFHNGANLFCGMVDVDGLCRSWSRTDFDVAAQQPFSILTKNIDERPESAPHQMLFIGSLGDDRDPVGMWPDGKVVRWDAENGIEFGATYENVFSFLLTESQRAELLFDSSGRRKSDSALN